jgi:AraC family transcriptional regulator
MCAVTSNAWRGWPLSSCHFETSGQTQAHEIPVDTLLVWSGGRSDVEVRCASRGYVVQRRSGMVDFLPAGLVIDQVRWRGQATSCIAVLLPPTQLETLGFDPQRRTEPERCLRIGVTDAHVVDLVRRLEVQASDGQRLGGLYVEGLSLALASYVYGHFAAERASTPAPGPGLSVPQRERLEALIEERLAEPLHLSQLAAEVGYSPDYFLRLFSATFGLSPHRYVTGRRVERAKAMLLDRDIPLVTVAFACGFSSQAHFSTVFKMHAGVTPGKYRNDGLAESDRSERDPMPDADTARRERAERVAHTAGLASLALGGAPAGTCPATLGVQLNTAQR